MTSRHRARFDHDPDAAGYDADVADETQPIRAGYEELLGWVATRADVGRRMSVLDLGAGTGNLTVRLRAARALTAVDSSARMLEIARTKCGARLATVQDDLLGYFASEPRFDRIVSTYAIHHLEDDEKRTLFEKIRGALLAGGSAIFGDLMFASVAARDEARRSFAARGATDVVEAIDDEFFWLLDDAVPALLSCGFRVETRRFSELSWGVCCRLV